MYFRAVSSNLILVCKLKITPPDLGSWTGSTRSFEVGCRVGVACNDLIKYLIGKELIRKIGRCEKLSNSIIIIRS